MSAMTAEIETLDADKLLAGMPEDVREFFRRESVRRREPVARVMESALVQVARDFSPESKPTAA